MSKLEQVKETLLKMKPEFEGALPKYINFDRFYNSIITTLTINPSLLDLNIPSLYSACMKAAVDGLIIDGKESALVPRKGLIKYDPMTAGITKKARNSGQIKSMDAVVVYKNDQYESWIDEKGQHFKHKKAEGDRGEVLLTYAYAITKDDGFYFEEIYEKEMKAIEACCTANQTPWKGPFKDEMRRKSALKRMCKYRLPSSTDIDTLINDEDEEYAQDNAEQDEKTEIIKENNSILDKIVEENNKENIEETQENETKQSTGVVEAVSTKNNQLAWKIDGLVYKTEDKSIFKMMEKSLDEKMIVRIFYNETTVDNKPNRFVIKAEMLTADEVIEDAKDIPL